MILLTVVFFILGDPSLRSSQPNLFSGVPNEFVLANDFFPAMDENVLIRDSIFQNLDMRAISVSIDQKKSCGIERCTFYNVSSPEDNSGAILYNVQGNISLSFVCFERCCTKEVGNYQSACLKTGKKGIISLYYSTVSDCNGPSGCYYPMYLKGGIEWVQGLNATKNTQFYYYSCPCFYPYEYLQMNYSSITNNHQTVHYSMHVQCDKANQNDIFMCNLIYNTNDHYSYYVYAFDGPSTTIIERCVIAKNSGMLFLGPTAPGFLFIISSSIAHYNAGYFTQRVVQIQTYQITDTLITQTHALQHLKTHLCHAEISIPFNESIPSELCFAYTPPQTVPYPTECFQGTLEPASILNIISILKIHVAALFF